MRNKRTDHDFDWVTARHSLTVGVQFGRLLADVGLNVETRNAQAAVGKRDPANDILTLTPMFQDPISGFLVTQREGPIRRERVVRFLPDNDGTIEISGYPHPASPLHVKVQVVEDGELWFKIKEEEEQGKDVKYRRWEILQMVLEPLFFGDKSS